MLTPGLQLYKCPACPMQGKWLNKGRDGVRAATSSTTPTRPLHLTHTPTLDRCSPPLKISTSQGCQQQECEEFLTKVMKR